MEISNLSDKGFKVMVTKSLTKLGRRTDEHSEKFNKLIENIRKHQIVITDLKNAVTEDKNILEGFSSTLDEAEKRNSPK